MAKICTESAQDAENRKFIEENLVELNKRKSVRYMLSATLKKNFFVRIFQALFYCCIYYPVFALFNRLVFRLHVKGKKHLKSIKKNGYVSICNHIHKLDNTFCARAVFPKKPLFTSLLSNFEMKGAGGFLKLLGVVPTPSNFVETRVFFYCLGMQLKRGKVVHFYPEGELSDYDMNLRPFQNGAFHLAATEKKPIVPMRIVYRPRKNPKKKPHMTLLIGEPVFPNANLCTAEATLALKAQATEVMQNLA